MNIFAPVKISFSVFNSLPLEGNHRDYGESKEKRTERELQNLPSLGSFWKTENGNYKCVILHKSKKVQAVWSYLEQADVWTELVYQHEQDLHYSSMDKRTKQI